MQHSGSLILHKKSVHEGVKYPCTICGYEATTNSSLARHIRSQHIGEKYQCTSCDKEYKHPSHLRQHIKTIHFRVRISCQICDYQATVKGNLSSHVKNVHQTSEKINCTECYKSIKASYIKQHMKLHTKQQTQHSCKVCPYTTIHSYYNLKSHVEKVHMNL